MQVSQSQAIEGTPVDVPVPRKVSFITLQKTIFHLSFFIYRALVVLLSVISWIVHSLFSQTTIHEETRTITNKITK